MRNSEPPDVIPVWIRYSLEQRPDDCWAWDWVKDQVAWAASLEDAWTIVVNLIRAAPDELLGAIGSGPIEDLVKRSGGELLDWIEGEAQRDPRFRDALGAMWLTRGVLSPTIEARLVAASGRRIQLLEANDVPDEDAPR